MKRILWFRRDLRVEDNPLLSLGGEVLPIFIFDTNILEKLPSSDKRVSFIFDAVLKLKGALKAKGLELKVFWGKPVEIFSALEKLDFDEVAASGDHDSYAKQRDIEISLLLHFRFIHDTYIFEPDEILKDNGTPYRVFTPFYHKAKEHFAQKHLIEYPFVAQKLFETNYDGITKLRGEMEETLALGIASLGFTQMPLPQIDMPTRLNTLKKRLSVYVKNRDYFDREATSGLSIDIRFGTLSIRAVLRFLVEQKKRGVETEPFFRQLIFRDFYAYLLFHFPRITKENYKYRFRGIPNKEKYEAFCTAKTGVPIIDAGIRELLETGMMHNRVRMICASFLTKDLLLPWQWGEVFFAKHLLDYDAASNILSWQWSAGTGIDPQPYFRIFNPYLQSKKYDKDAVYIKKWLPPLTALDPKQIYDETFLISHPIKDYPIPIIVHKEASRNALSYFKQKL